MAINRHRLKYLVKQNRLGARKTQALLGQTEQLLSFVLVGNSLVNTIIPVITTSIALRTFGSEGWVLSVNTGIIAFLIIIFSEITPKIVGATYPEKIALPASLVISPLMRIGGPFLRLINSFASAILWVLRINTRNAPEARLSTDELRTMVLESGGFMPHKPKSILLNLFDLENISVDDVMVPRTHIEALDLQMPLEPLLGQLQTCYHNQLPVYQGDIDQIIGVLHVRKALATLHQREELTHETLRECLSTPYFVPSGTPVLQQLQYFQEHRQRVGLVVDEYGQLQGLVTSEDIIEEIIGEFTTSLPRITDPRTGWDAAGECIVPGRSSLRELNRALNLHFSVSGPTATNGHKVSGPKTLNGLILEILHDIPEGDVSLEVNGCKMEVLHFDAHGIKTVKLFKPTHKAAD